MGYSLKIQLGRFHNHNSYFIVGKLRTVTEKKRVIHDPAISLFINQFLNVVSLLKAIFIYFWNVN